MKSFHSFLHIKENRETGAMKAIRNGLGIKESFWDDFILLLNNAEAVSDLFDVPVEKVGTWHETIKNSINKVQGADKEVIPKNKKRLLKTGLPEDL